MAYKWILHRWRIIIRFLFLNRKYTWCTLWLDINMLLSVLNYILSFRLTKLFYINEKLSNSVINYIFGLWSIDAKCIVVVYIGSKKTALGRFWKKTNENISTEENRKNRWIDYML